MADKGLSAIGGAQPPDRHDWKEPLAMQEALHLRATVQPGGKVEIASPELTEGERVDVTISPTPTASARSAWQVISEAPGQRLFKTAKDVDDYIADERASWSR